ncbi:hypothetical protein [uncultured Enterococcus sp.]|uniref:hypothetical protein n=1 Tax=uncultured Enterococcus sp. TaxID=167972 RepID=UPI002AA65F5F|nr:hypothetical protein [uncultured Enterococcus sp.]
MSYNYYEFIEPHYTLLIAKSPEAALHEYEEEIAGIQGGVSFEEISQEDCLEKLAQLTTEEMPTIEYGLSRSVLDIQESLFCLAETGRAAIILDVSRSAIQEGSAPVDHSISFVR